MEKKYLIAGALIVVAVIGISALSFLPEKVASSELDAFNQCLADSGATFYGAFWCPHCAEQKEILEQSKNIPYVECSPPNRQGQYPVCTEAGVQSYPTWTFADGTTVPGVHSLDQLAEKSGCALPGAVVPE